MERIKSFCVDHTKLKKGVYISRVDDTLITYDIRMCEPNVDTPLDPNAAHTIEHIGATLLRNRKYADKIIYFGPMGCRTGFYVIFAGDLKSEDIIGVLREAADYVLNYDDNTPIPGYSPRDCGNYLDNNLKLAKIYMRKFKEEVLDNPVEERLSYPQ